MGRNGFHMSSSSDAAMAAILIALVALPIGVIGWVMPKQSSFANNVQGNSTTGNPVIDTSHVIWCGGMQVSIRIIRSGNLTIAGNVLGRENVTGTTITFQVRYRQTPFG